MGDKGASSSDLDIEKPIPRILRERLARRYAMQKAGVGRFFSRSVDSIKRLSKRSRHEGVLLPRSEEFRRAKRNFLWASSATLLLGFTNGTEPIGLLLSDLKIDQGWLSIFLIAYTLFLGWTYWHQAYLLKIASSTAAAPGDKETDEVLRPQMSKLAMRKINNNIDDLLETIEVWKAILEEQFAAQKSSESVEKLKSKSTEVKSYIEKVISEFQIIVSTVRNVEDKRIQDIDFQSRLVGAEVLIRDMREFGIQFEKVSKSAYSAESPWNELDIESTIEKVIDQEKRLNEVTAQVSIRIDDLQKISDAIDASEFRFFAIAEMALPFGLAALAIIACTVNKWPAIWKVV